jgi:hypothetical protein
MAIISLIAGILGLTFIPFLGSIIAVITGMMARKEIRESGGALAGDGLAVAGLVMGWIGVGLGALGVCIGLAFAIPACLLLFNVSSTQSYNLILPTLLALL